ncbi:MAG: tRNA uridine-5-carboxymethylaminomethyl(34) synthesis GTPase MnmE [Rhodospirillaceae bacterium]|nr:tRNA uridine-5-carboxymethylaminomethyl(34) synthesis GTPase MnmE [Rhodospirillaceae bacterium]
MKQYSFTDTIFALATPPGRSALAVIRVSGPRAGYVAKLFGTALLQPRQAQRRWLKDKNGKLIDDVMMINFIGPHSATGEDVTEIHCHGSPAVVEDILNHLAATSGFRLAEAGEFTRRALDHNKTDITSAEGLADLIDADTSLQREQAVAQMSGSLRRPVESWRSEIISCLSELETLIDFADEELPTSLETQIKNRIKIIHDDMKASLSDFHKGQIIRSGLSVVLAGPVNAGKSTLLNLLARRPAAIVSEIPGTTRDSIEVGIEIAGIPVLVKDTAGWRQTDDPIEKEGIDRARQAAEDADVLVFVVDGNQAGWSAELFETVTPDSVPPLLLLNKSDKGIEVGNVQHITARFSEEDVIYISAKDGAGLSAFERRLEKIIRNLNRSSSSVTLTRVRHQQAVRQAVEHLQASLCLSAVDQTEFIAEEFRLATSSLSRILGQVDIEDVLDHIFSSFCIGK